MARWHPRDGAQQAQIVGRSNDLHPARCRVLARAIPRRGHGMFKGGDIRVARVVGLGRLTLSRRERMVMLWRFLSLPVLELIDVFHERAWGRAGLMIERQPGRCGQTRDYVGPARPD
jgi:hypothetical protein